LTPYKNQNINIEKIRQGDIQEYELLYHQYCQPLVLFANRFVYDLDFAENIVQDVFLNIWVNREKLDPAGNIKTYLYTLVKNSALNTIKHLKVEHNYKETVTIIESDNNTPETDFSFKELEQTLNKVIKKLPEKCRTIFLMSRQDHLSYKEIAQVLGISVKTVENQMGKALKVLRKNLSRSTFMLFFC
jgi:RNA polymerase sigma-70 factor (family 1)